MANLPKEMSGVFFPIIEALQIQALPQEELMSKNTVQLSKSETQRGARGAEQAVLCVFMGFMRHAQYTHMHMSNPSTLINMTNVA